MASVPWSRRPIGEFLGTANDYYGLAIFRANARGQLPSHCLAPQRRGSTAPDPPDRLEIEPIKNGSALLSWQLPSQSARCPQCKRPAARCCLPAPSDKRFQIWRAEVNLILLRDDLNFEGWNGTTGNKIPDYYVGPYTQIAVTEDLSYIDSTVQPGKQYMYYVIEDDNPHRLRTVEPRYLSAAHPADDVCPAPARSGPHGPAPAVPQSGQTADGRAHGDRGCPTIGSDMRYQQGHHDA